MSVALNTRPDNLSGWLSPGLGADLVATSTGDNWPGTTALEAGATRILATVSGTSARWTLTAAQVTALLGDAGGVACEVVTGTGEAKRTVLSGTLARRNRYTQGATGTQVIGSVLIGPAGTGIASVTLDGTDLIVTLGDETQLPPVPLPSVEGLIADATQAASDAQAAQVGAEAAQTAAEGAASAAGLSESAAAGSASAALASEQAAALSESASGQSALDAGTAQGLAEAARDAASGYADDAAASALAASGSASDASDSAATATTQAGLASGSASDANTYKLAAQSAQTGAETARDQAATARDAAQGYATTATSAASTATTQAGIATTKADQSAGSATTASAAKDDAVTAKLAAQAAETAAQGYAVTAQTAANAYPTGGTTGQALVKTSNADYATTWVTQIPASIVDAKGDLIVATGADAVARVAVGSAGQALMPDSTKASGVTWGNPGTISAFPVIAAGVGSDNWALPPGHIGNAGMNIVAVSAGSIWYWPIICAEPITVTALAVRTTTGAANSVARVGFATADASWQPATFIAEAPSTFSTAAIAVVAQTGLSISLPKGRNLLMFRTEGGNPSLAYFPAFTPFSNFNGSLSAGGVTTAGMGVNSTAAFSTIPKWAGPTGAYGSFAFMRWEIA